jgi:multicomponent Na+:H+ antiporter subunit D
MNILLLLPILVPFVAAIVSLLLWRRPDLQRGLNVIAAVLLFVAGLALLASVRQGGIQAGQLANWPAPFGITLVADLMAAILVMLCGLMGLCVAVYSLQSMDPRREAFGYYPLLHILLMGVNGAFLTGDMFNLYVWFEVMLIASFVLLALGGERPQLEGAIKYVTLNLMSSALFLAAVGILYGIAGTLNMADLAIQLNAVPDTGLVTTLAMLFLVAFGVKAAIFPLFFWLPASYHTPPVAVSAIFAGLLTKVGVYALVRVFTLLFVQEIPYTHTIILVIAAFTMVTGVLGAVAQSEFRRILAFHSVSQIGYMVMGLGLFTPLALAGSLYFMFHHSIVKSNLFLVSGIAYHIRGTYQLKKLGGLYPLYSGLALLFLIPALSLAGIPPLSGFWAKVILVQAGLETQQYLLVGVSLAVGLLTLFSMTKIWAEAFWKPLPEDYPDDAPLRRSSWVVLASPIVLLALMAVVMGLAAGPVITLTVQAAEQLLNPTLYINAVLGRT